MPLWPRYVRDRFCCHLQFCFLLLTCCSINPYHRVLFDIDLVDFDAAVYSKKTINISVNTVFRSCI